jgi:hypothetical protein
LDFFGGSLGEDSEAEVSNGLIDIGCSTTGRGATRAELLRGAMSDIGPLGLFGFLNSTAFSISAIVNTANCY